MNIKYLVWSLGIVMTMTACNNSTKTQEATTDSVAMSNSDSLSPNEDAGPKGKVEFDESVFEFGTVKEGAVVEHIFKFTNTGEAPVILSQVSASCGCTTPEYTKDPVLPGKTGEIKVSFNSQGQAGNQQKIVTVASNAENHVTTVQIKGLVEAAK